MDKIDPATNGFPSIYDSIQKFNSRHHKDGYSGGSSGNVNMGTNISIPASAVSTATGNTTESSNTNNTNDNGDDVDNIQKRRYLESSLPQRFEFEDPRYQVSHQFPVELERLILKKGKVFEGLLSWVFLRARPQLKQFFDEIADYVKDGMSMDAYDVDNFVLMKHRWELMCLSVRIDDSYYQQISNETVPGNQYNISSFHRARSSSSAGGLNMKYGMSSMYHGKSYVECEGKHVDMFKWLLGRF